MTEALYQLLFLT